MTTPAVSKNSRYHTPGGKEAVKKSLAQVLVWETIPEEFFEKLWKSMPDREAGVLEARGGYTRY